MTTKKPVLVIGNGPVGQTTALFLAHWGVPTIVLDGRPHRDPVGSKAIVQQRDVLDAWDTLGHVGREITEAGLTWLRARTFYREDELFCTEYADAGRSPFPPFVNISQSGTEAMLDERIAAEPLIEVRWGHEVVDLAQDADGVTVTCATASGPTQVAGSFAVACSGARGEAVRRLLGVTLDGRTFGDLFLICDIKADLGTWDQERRFYFDPVWNPGRQVLIHPCPGSTFRIDWQVPEDFDIAAEEASGGLDRRIRQIVGDKPYEIVWKSAYRFHQRIADRFRAGRVLLAGGAAHLVSPFGARGLNSGVQDSENAAWKLAFVWRGLAPETLLDTYHDERHAAASENLAVTGATMDFLVPQDEAQVATRLSILEKARSDRSAQDRVDSGRLAEPFWYDASPLTTASPERPCGGRPVRGQAPAVAPGVLIPDHPFDGGGRLRLLARRGVTVLCGENVDLAGLSELTFGELPVSVHRLSTLHPDAPTVLGLRADETWVVRPDAHLAATLVAAEPSTVRAAVERVVGLDTRATA
ncbi:FAD-dependent monooxygenase [Streptomyces sp. M2CJ-2]|uniref:FAD-dependent monooxygenase n=1 Tax=Streptomyces sp. M2CJ-2 TaxID=2803948 RepID=UPI00192687A1|nr:FAD-dependent monooxygenase [Streptomyces sp. M2CJ-2]MBL3667242.1 FAD-dependent monooxygenase [Streptomyces sp. M2CJ-2]